MSDLNALKNDGTKLMLDESVVEEFRSKLQGDILTAQDAEYEEVRKRVIKRARWIRRQLDYFRQFDLEFSPGVNVLVGRNDSGKSTVIEAINLALTGRLHGRAFAQEFSPYLINAAATWEYVELLNASSDPPPPPPAVKIEVFLEDSEEAEVLRGTNNLYGENACGVRIQAKLSQDFYEEYANFISDPSTVRLAPTEYYRIEWIGFSGNGVSMRSIPATASVIDPTTIRLQSGVDYPLAQRVKTNAFQFDG